MSQDKVHICPKCHEPMTPYNAQTMECRQCEIMFSIQSPKVQRPVKASERK